MLLLTTVSLFMALGTTLCIPAEKIAQVTLPEVQIVAKRSLPNMSDIMLLEVTIRSTKLAARMLPEVVITATRLPKV